MSNAMKLVMGTFLGLVCMGDFASLPMPDPNLMYKAATSFQPITSYNEGLAAVQQQRLNEQKMQLNRQKMQQNQQAYDLQQMKNQAYKESLQSA